MAETELVLPVTGETPWGTKVNVAFGTLQVALNELLTPEETQAAINAAIAAIPPDTGGVDPSALSAFTQVRTGVWNITGGFAGIQNITSSTIKRWEVGTQAQYDAIIAATPALASDITFVFDVVE